MYVQNVRTRRDLAWVAASVGCAMWFVAIVYAFLRIDLWILDLVVVPLLWGLLMAGLLCTAIGLGCLRGWGRVLGLAVVLPVFALVTAVFAPWWQFAPREWFATHRELYEQALEVEPGTDYYGNRLPRHLGFLTSSGRVSGSSGSEGIRFFPQWQGVPDDAGGFLYSRSGPPIGFDMYGMTCTAPTSLGDGWWMCGMRA